MCVEWRVNEEATVTEKKAPLLLRESLVATGVCVYIFFLSHTLCVYFVRQVFLMTEDETSCLTSV